MKTRLLDNLLLSGLILSAVYAFFMVLDTMSHLMNTRVQSLMPSRLAWIAVYVIYAFAVARSISWMLRKRLNHYPPPGLGRWQFFVTYLYGRYLTLLETCYKMPQKWGPLLSYGFVIVSWMAPGFILANLMRYLVPIDASIDTSFWIFCFGIGLIFVNAIAAGIGLYWLLWREYASASSGGLTPAESRSSNF